MHCKNKITQEFPSPLINLESLTRSYQNLSKMEIKLFTKFKPSKEMHPQMSHEKELQTYDYEQTVKKPRNQWIFLLGESTPMSNSSKGQGAGLNSFQWKQAIFSPNRNVKCCISFPLTYQKSNMNFSGHTQSQMGIKCKLL